MRSDGGTCPPLRSSYRLPILAPVPFQLRFLFILPHHVFILRLYSSFFVLYRLPPAPASESLYVFNLSD